jgi:hypothetical protein
MLSDLQKHPNATAKTISEELQVLRGTLSKRLFFEPTPLNYSKY